MKTWDDTDGRASPVECLTQGPGTCASDEFPGDAASVTAGPHTPPLTQPSMAELLTSYSRLESERVVGF